MKNGMDACKASARDGVLKIRVDLNETGWIIQWKFTFFARIDRHTYSIRTVGAAPPPSAMIAPAPLRPMLALTTSVFPMNAQPGFS